MRPALPSGLRRLPSDERAVLVLRDVLGWELDDLAELLDMRVDAVNCVLLRAGDFIGTVDDPGPTTDS